MLPSATELVYALGCQDMLFGVTHECTYPCETASKPRIVKSVLDTSSMSSAEIDAKARLFGQDIFEVNMNLLHDIMPDIILVQDACRVCAPHAGSVSEALNSLPHKPLIHSMDPHSIGDIMDGVTTLAGILGVSERGARLRASLEERIARIDSSGERPRVLALEWLDPLFTSGHWIPEMIEAAGGTNLVSSAGERSREMTVQEAAGADADIILLMPCGFDAARAASEYDILKSSKEWQSQRAVQDGNVYALDANSHFSKPSIRAVDGIEILAGIMHPGNKNVAAPRNAAIRIPCNLDASKYGSSQNRSS